MVMSSSINMFTRSLHSFLKSKVIFCCRYPFVSSINSVWIAEELWDVCYTAMKPLREGTKHVIMVEDQKTLANILLFTLEKCIVKYYHVLVTGLYIYGIALMSLMVMLTR